MVPKKFLTIQIVRTTATPNISIEVDSTSFLNIGTLTADADMMYKDIKYFCVDKYT